MSSKPVFLTTSLSPTALIAWSACLIFAWLVYCLFLRPFLSPLSRLPGPKNESIFFGNLGVLFGPEGGVHQWHLQYGPTFAYRGFFGVTRLSTIDPKALSHILISRAYTYPKPETTRRTLGNLLGRGLLFAEGETHKRQKRLLAPTFSPAQIKELEPVMYDSAYLLQDKWADMIRASQKPYLVINVLPWLSRATLDIIGSAGFGYKFGALDGDESSSKLGEAFQKLSILGSEPRRPVKMVLGDLLRTVPPSLLPYKLTSMRIIKASLSTMEAECRALLAKKKAEAAAGGSLIGKDLISVLVRANIAASGKDCLSDEEVIGQLTTFLVAGHETTATALTWLLWILAKHPEVQEKLRKELQESKTDLNNGGQQSDKLTSLPFLDAVCRETLRFRSPVSQTIRQAFVNDTIPVSGNGPPINIAAGELVTIPISAFHLSQAAFGPDAEVFRPERWLEGGRGGGPPGVWAGLLVFLGGPRACIGYRFALLELKILIAVICSRFRFEERDGLGGGPEIEGRMSVVMRPQVKGDEPGASMPLRVSLV
ncbi:hypothetical protein CROQUDRAFT_77651 [Cronartium quercuum f. sp. fusiforme G11]|uniref:Cytochrome P450 n=1 Tax=Cronartium quercuum f. sp. fusiforme G11 TaxID=708437 RepID=A0A9P6NM01_9BASI|nr:hypothetical protein CROQUDRAFT_77651 [Cronartium quercuum f. sp. fusiforme G11]